MSLTPGEVYRLAVAHGLDAERAVVATAIAWAESGLDPFAVGDVSLQDDTWGPSVGLWQIRSLRADTGTGKERDIERLGDPGFNTRAMVAISTGGANWQPWTVWRNGSYLAHIGAVRAAVTVTPVEIIRAVIADLKAAGIPVKEIDGWEDRGRPYAFNPRGAVDHHTATKGYQYDYPSLGIVRDGRSDLPGPLSNFGIGRHTGTVYVIAAGFCNHAGGGGWNGLRGNGSVWGASEAENDGIGEEIAPEQMKARLHLHAALCRHTGYGPEMICAHREWSDGGKIDPTGVEGDWLRSAVTDLLNAGPTPEPEPEPDLEVPDLFIFDYKVGDDHRGILYSDGFYYWGVTGETLAFYNTGKVPHVGAKGEAFMADLTWRERPSDRAGIVATASEPTDLVEIDGCVTLYGPVSAVRETG